MHTNKRIELNSLQDYTSDKHGAGTKTNNTTPQALPRCSRHVHLTSHAATLHHPAPHPTHLPRGAAHRPRITALPRSSQRAPAALLPATPQHAHRTEKRAAAAPPHTLSENRAHRQASPGNRTGASSVECEGGADAWVCSLRLKREGWGVREKTGGWSGGRVDQCKPRNHLRVIEQGLEWRGEGAARGARSWKDGAWPVTHDG